MLKGNIRKYVLENAVKHNGSAAISSIIGKLINDDPSIKNKLKEISKFNPNKKKFIPRFI